jgi:MOSC domain-containing protein YiiM
VRIGDILRVGEALLQVSEPRIPCFKLVMRMEAGADFAARFLKSGRLGYYLRVIEEGGVAAGDAVSFVEQAPESPTMAEFIRVSQFETHDLAALRRIQPARGLSAKWGAVLQKHIDRAAS